MDTGKVLLDREMGAPVVAEIREVIEANNNIQQTKLVDLHVWRVGQRFCSCALSVVTEDANLTASKIRDDLSIHEEIEHSTIEVHYQASKS